MSPHGYNYIVDLTSLAQVNKLTSFRRQVRRQCNLPYPLASQGPPAIPSGPACSCQQCLSHSSTGPMPSRSRHSFSSGSLNRPSLQGPGRAVAAHPASVYSPYPRRPLSVGGMSWGSPWPPPPSGSQLPAPLLTGSNSANGLRSVSSFHLHTDKLGCDRKVFLHQPWSGCVSGWRCDAGPAEQTGRCVEKTLFYRAVMTNKAPTKMGAANRRGSPITQ